MICKPKFMKPSSLFADSSVIDANNGASFSCLIDGDEPIGQYRLTIYDMINNEPIIKKIAGQITGNTDSTVSDEKNVFVFYPTDEKGNNKTFSTTISCKDANGNILIENRTEPYYWILEVWSVSDCHKEVKENLDKIDAIYPTATSAGSVFYANSIPDIQIKYSSDGTTYEMLEENREISSNQLYFSGSYKQSEGIALKRFGWRLIDTDTNSVLVDTISHGQIYGISENIKLFYSGFSSNGKYSIELFIETQNGCCIKTPPIAFAISYNTIFLDNGISVQSIRDEAAIKIDWSDAVIAESSQNGEIYFIRDYPVANHVSVEIPEQSTITYEYLSTNIEDIKDDSTIVLSTRLIDDEDSIIFQIEGEDDSGNVISRKLGYRLLENNQKQFYYLVLNNGSGIEKNILLTESHFPSECTWYTFIMSPNELKIKYHVASGGIYPSETTYPSDSEYPSFGSWDTQDNDAVLEENDISVSEVVDELPEAQEEGV